MSKYEFLKTKHVVPIHKKYVWKYEDGYNGEIKEVEFKIYPYTVQEKLEMQQENEIVKNAMKEAKTDEEKFKCNEKLEEIAYKSVWLILKKDDPEILLDTVRKIPLTVINDLIYKALEFEGVNRTELESQAKKLVDEL